VKKRVRRQIVWVAVACSAVAGIAVAMILLRGDPTYLVQPHTRGGTPWGPPVPISFPYRAISVTILAVSLVAAGRRAVSADGMLLWPLALAGYALFILDVIVSAMAGKAFPEFLAVVWFTIPLPLLLYSEPLAEPLKAPAWVVWGLCFLVLAGRLVWLVFVQFSA